MDLKPYKVVIQVVLQEVEDDVVVGERATEGIAVYAPSPERMAAWYEDFERQLKEATE